MPFPKRLGGMTEAAGTGSLERTLEKRRPILERAPTPIARASAHKQTTQNGNFGRVRKGA